MSGLDRECGFQPVEIDEVDARLAVMAERKNIPSMVASEVVVTPVEEESNPQPVRAPIKPMTIDVPDYLRVALKVDAARKGVSVRYLVLCALVEAGFDVRAEDMMEDGRRLR